ncbi:hypothetical protein NLJ89_g2184 [Agrocybe chaxingu]|uniref:MFS general substrate transporter n=1 Tax=Agrocybe chaxingu TaxID=84603 RepID=A0A9W8KBE7_9AGAR|nr:hypothetical protein NLJ89_g2184 [Agrocybe chaxingu]
MATRDDKDVKLSEKDGSSVDSLKLESNEQYDAEFERKTMRYVDWRIIPVLAMVYSFALIDRINLGAAHTAGMGVDLGLMTGDRFSIISCMYFVPYILLQLPGNLVLRNSESASFFPSLLWIITAWYKRHEVHKRLAVFYLISVTAGGLSPILAYVFSLLKGRGGLEGWRWIFIIEGLITLFLGLITWLFIPAFPDQNNFLTPEQTKLVLKRIDDDRGDAIPDPLTAHKVFKHLRDWTLWAYGIMFMCAAMPSYAQSFFIPIILRGMGWSQTAALLLSAPPYGPSIPTTMLVAYLSDKYKHRSGFIVLCVVVCLTGVSLLAWAKQDEVRYFGAFLTNAGNSGAIPTILAYSSNNVVSHSKRSVQTAMVVSLGGIGGILATTVFRAIDYPRYIPGLGATLGSQGLLLLLLATTTIHFTRLNRQMRQGKRQEPLEGQPGFFYTL